MAFKQPDHIYHIIPIMAATFTVERKGEDRT
jgi:hypothetical protein